MRAIGGEYGSGRLDFDEIWPLGLTPKPSYPRMLEFGGKGRRKGVTEVRNARKRVNDNRAADKTGVEVGNKLLHGTGHAEGAEGIKMIVGRRDTDSKGDSPEGAAERAELCVVMRQGILSRQHVGNMCGVLRSYKEGRFGLVAWREVR